MAEKVVNGFMKGMSKDLHYSLLDNQKYIYAENFRLISSGFNTTGAIENIKGNKFIGDYAFLNTTSLIDGHVYLVAGETVIYNNVTYSIYSTFTCTIANGLTFSGTGRVVDITAYGIPEDMYIVGGVELRDSIILFTTDTIQRSQIYKLTLNGSSYGSINTLEILYDDEYNIDDSRLNLNINYPIKAVSRYETPNIQKVYWTDGLNPLRYININKNCTTTGELFTVDGDYWGIDKFEFLPNVVLSKPIVTGITTGTISTGMVFYAYQLYIENGAESAISYISDPVHITSDNDYYVNDLYYEGDGVDSVKSKGFIVNINLSGNDTFNRLKLIRVHYESFNQTPGIYVAADIPINLDNNSITITDIGSVITELTVDEFSIDATEIFICQELATKNNILFAGNIEKKTFNISDFDARAVRYKSYTEFGSGYDYVNVHLLDESPEDDYDYVTTQYWGPNSIYISIYNFKEWAGIPADRTLTDIPGYLAVSCLADRMDLTYRNGYNVYTISSSNISFINTIWNGVDLIFEVTAPEIMFIGTPIISRCELYNSTIGGPVFGYNYIATGATTIVAHPRDISHSYGTCSILAPTDPFDPSAWNIAGWHNYHEDHDGINDYNNPDNDASYFYQYIYKSDGTTLGAEGPNISIEFAWEDIIVDNIANTASTYYVGTITNGSYSNYSSPLNGGKLSWQRDEVYRLFISFKNKRGQDTEPKWICDLRIPKMVGDIYGVISNRFFSLGQVRRIYPVITIKSGSWPTDAVSAQVYRVPRNREDRQIVTQALAYPFVDVSGLHLSTGILPLNYYSSDNENLVKLVSPEINITKNITKSGNDYLEYLTNFNNDKLTTGGYTYVDTRSIIKCRANTARANFNSNDYTDIVDTVSVIPIEGDPANNIVGGTTFYNYNDTNDIDAKGCSGIVVKYANNNWSAEGQTLALINYKNNCWNSQYGGLTYENRQYNNMIPCSDIIYEEGVEYNCNYGDTFINYFDVSTLLYDLSKVEGNTPGDSCSEAIYVPLESSINCNLRSSDFEMHKQYNVTYSYMIQEELGAHMFTDSYDNIRVYNQTDDMYKYNTVYSQQPLVAALISIDESRQIETVFDTQVRASNAKINGEYIDSWTKFGVNETLEVDSKYGSLNAMLEYGQSLYFWQDEAFGVLAVNDKSLIQDNNTAKLVLGTGGVLDRFDYISTQKGCKDKFSVVGGVGGVYWIDRRNMSIDRFAESLTDLALQKEVKSIFNVDTEIATWPKYMAVQDKLNNEILFTLANYKDGIITNPGVNELSLNRPFTISYNETMDCFTSEYSFKPYVYIPFNNTFLSATTHNPLEISVPYPMNLLFTHNIDDTIQARNNFYGLYYNDILGRYRSKLRTVFNPFYLSTKVFDNMFYNGEVKITSNVIDTYKKTVNEVINNELSPINSILFYNDYQTTGPHNLIYKTNLERRERVWQTIIPRNDIETLYPLQSNNPQIEDTSGIGTTYPERMRDKYIVCEIDTPYSTNNTNSYRVIIDNLGVTYRNSYR